MENQIDEVKKKIDIVEFIGAHIELKKAGRNFRAICPFHQEKSPSFIVSPDRQIWHCFGSCGEGGDVIKFHMKWENIPFGEAFKELAQKAGVALKEDTTEDEEWKKKAKLMSLNQLAAQYFEYILHSTSYGEKARKYLDMRGIHSQIIKKFQLGYSLSSWNSLLNFLKKKKFTVYEIFEAGLIVKSDNGTYYDRFRGRLMFPIKDIRGNIVGFSGRMLKEDTQGMKYVNSPETPIYHKRESLFGIHLAKEGIRKLNNVILVEGEFDMITPYQHGIENIVAIKGSAVTKEQLLLLKRYTGRITLALDGDEAGEEAAKRAIQETEQLELETFVCVFDYAKDPDEAVKKDLILFKKLIAKPEPIYDFLISLSEKKHGTEDAFARKTIGDEIAPFISRIANPIVKSFYIKKLSDLLEVKEEAIEDLIKKSSYEKRKRWRSQFTKTQQEESPQREYVLQKYLIGVMFQNESPYSIAEELFNILSVEDLTIPSLKKLCALFLEYKQKNHVFNLEVFVATLPAELKAVLNELYLFASTDAIGEVSIRRLAYEIKKYSLKLKITRTVKSDDTPSSSLHDWATELKEVEKKMSSL
ncbi:MAG: DNA primase [bacterium]|nr:DNA primase [bacterium]